MARTRGASAGVSGAEPIIHLAARAEDAMHVFREKRARKRGHTPTVIPYTGYGAPGWVRVLCRVLLTKPAPDGAGRYKKIRGWRSFTSVPVNDIAVTIEVNGTTQRVVADRGGVVDTLIEVDLPPGWHTITIRTDEAESVEAPIFIVDPTVDVGLISDIDDTVMVTALPRPFLAAWNTFVLDEHARRPVPGMAVLYERLTRAHPGTPVFYLSTGAWNVAPTLSRFLSRNLYPSGPLLLTDWGPTHDRWFRSGRDHKIETLERLAAGHTVASRWRRWATRRRDLRQLREEPPGKRDRYRHPPTVEQRSRACRRTEQGRRAGAQYRTVGLRGRWCRPRRAARRSRPPLTIRNPPLA
jgi:hypothetical protein